MILRFVQESILRAPRRKALIIAAIAMGSAVATAMLGVMLDIGDKINSELRSEGANIAVTAQAAAVTGGVGSIAAGAAGTADYIPESEVPNIKKIFWALNVIGFSPSLSAQDGALQVEGVWFKHVYPVPTGGTQVTGLEAVNPGWHLREGHWPEGALNECLAGSGVARRSGWKTHSEITVLGAPFRIAGILQTGDEADDRVFLPLQRVQELTARPAVVDRIDVAALTKPEDDFAHRDPNTMTASDKERWSCSNYVTSMAYEIEQALPGTVARPVRRVADNEGKILSHVSGLMELITLVALLSAGLTVWSLTAATMVDRRGEIAIMQAIGAGRWIVATLFGFEIALVGLVGGVIGAFAGVALAHYVGLSVFQEPVAVSPVLPFLIVPAAMAIAVAGAAQPLRRALRMEPAVTLREGL
jgi:putative ABC transport system permease protein